MSMLVEQSFRTKMKCDDGYWRNFNLIRMLMKVSMNSICVSSRLTVECRYVIKRISQWICSNHAIIPYFLQLNCIGGTIHSNITNQLISKFLRVENDMQMEPLPSFNFRPSIFISVSLNHISFRWNTFKAGTHQRKLILSLNHQLRAHELQYIEEIKNSITLKKKHLIAHSNVIAFITCNNGKENYSCKALDHV